MTDIYYTFDIGFTVCSFLFYIFLIIIYFHKSVIYSIKNAIFKRMIFLGITEFLFELFYLFLVRFSQNIFLIGLFCKLKMFIFLIILFFWTYYVIILIFEKRNSVTTFIQQHRRMIDLIIFVTVFVLFIIELFLPFSILKKGKAVAYLVSGTGIIFPYIISLILSLIPIPCIIFQKCGFQKQMIPYYCVLLLLVLLNIFYYFCPMISLMGFIITISYYIIYYRLENPDIMYIRNYYKEHERFRSFREKYGFLFNMSPELRDLLNEISFMKDNYLVDEKKHISKRKLETLISDFIKSSEIGKTKKTNVDDDGIEILDLEEDIPDELLVTKEIYSLKELQEILKEDNLPKW